MLIGLGYRARSGKNEVANILERRCAFTQFAYADALKDACSRVFGLTLKQLHGEDKEQIDPFWGVTPRTILQKVGTECFRKGFADDVWVRALERRLQLSLKLKRNIAITDVRFPNEAEAIKKWGGLVIRVDRDIAGASGGVVNHASETSLDGWKGWDYVIANSGTLADLEDSVTELAASLGLQVSSKQMVLPI